MIFETAYLKRLGEKEIFQGKLIQIIHRDFEYHRDGDSGNFTAEIARRPPGVRCLIVKGDKLLLTKEYRAELGGWDYRIPGGKVFDSLRDFLKNVDKDIFPAVEQAVDKEALEEVGIIVKKKKFLHKSVSGASIEWDLYYYEISDFDFSTNGQELEAGEIIVPEWITFDKAKELCLNNGIQEDRSVAVLLRYLYTKTQ